MQQESHRLSVPLCRWHKDTDDVVFFGLKRKVFEVRADCLSITGANSAIMMYAVYKLHDELMKTPLYKQEMKRDLNLLMKEVYNYENKVNIRYDESAVDLLLDYQLNFRTKVKGKIERFYNALRIAYKKAGIRNEEVRAWAEVAVTSANAASEILLMYKKEMEANNILLGNIEVFLSTERIFALVHKIYARLCNGHNIASEKAQRHWDILFKAACSGKIIMESMSKAAKDNNL